jgi:hypothetical protein
MIVLISITLALIALWVIAQISDKEDLSVASVVILIFWAIFGFGFWACTPVAPWNTKYKEEKAIVTEVLKGKHVVVVSTVCEDTKNNNTLFTNNEVDYINDSTQFYWLIEYNEYNYETSRTLKFKNK